MFSLVPQFLKRSENEKWDKFKNMREDIKEKRKSLKQNNTVAELDEMWSSVVGEIRNSSNIVSPVFYIKFIKWSRSPK